MDIKALRPKVNILVVEDDNMSSFNLRAILGKAGYLNINVTDHATAAVKKITREEADIVLLDWWLEGHQGIEIFDVLSPDELKMVPVIMVTSESDQQNVALAIEKGCFGYVLKPFGAKDLVESVDAALSYVEKQKTISKR